MISFKEEKEEIKNVFKISKKSICHGCIYFKDECNSVKLSLLCETDTTIKKAYVTKCTGFKDKDVFYTIK